MRLFTVICLLVTAACGSAPHNVVSSVPTGSKLSELDHYLKRGAGSSGEVIEWVSTSGPPHKNEELVRNEFGTFIPNKLGSYDDWKASPDERNSFTGEITFTHHGLTSSDANTFIYVKGKLRKKDWGYLPG